MKLDRNKKTDGTCKYALVNLRKVAEVLQTGRTSAPDVAAAIETLRKAGVLTFGNESHGQQFFVMKYRDRFTAPAMQAYWQAAMGYALEIARGRMDESLELAEYAGEIFTEAIKARAVGEHIPD